MIRSSALEAAKEGYNVWIKMFKQFVESSKSNKSLPEKKESVLKEKIEEKDDKKELQVKSKETSALPKVFKNVWTKVKNEIREKLNIIRKEHENQPVPPEIQEKRETADNSLDLETLREIMRVRVEEIQKNRESGIEQMDAETIICEGIAFSIMASTGISDKEWEFL